MFHNISRGTDVVNFFNFFKLTANSLQYSIVNILCVCFNLSASLWISSIYLPSSLLTLSSITSNLAFSLPIVVFTSAIVFFKSRIST